LFAQKKGSAKHKVVNSIQRYGFCVTIRAVKQVENIRMTWADAENEMVCLSGGLISDQ